MSSQKDHVVDEELFQFYLQFQLRKIKKSMRLWNDSSEKDAIINILNSCQYVNGNTLRMIFDDIFDNSVQMFTPPRTAVTTANKPVVKEEEGHGSTSHADASKLGSEGTEPTPLYDSTDNENEHTTQSDEESQSDYRDSDDEELKSKINKTRNNDLSLPSFLQYTVTKSACNDLRVMLSNLRVTKDIFRSRMNIIKDSFKIHYKLRSQNSPSTEPNCRFEIINHFNYRESMGQCQLNLIAYQLGKIEEMEKEALSTKQVKVNRCQYYYDLSVSLNEPKMARDSQVKEFPRYCERAKQVVEKLGVYVLFMPEIMPPTLYRKMRDADFPRMKDYLDSKCSQFKDIARFDGNGNLIVSEQTGDLSKFLKTGIPYNSRFVDFSL
ncbi:unnamed protein product [Mucor circinelloides]